MKRKHGLVKFSVFIFIFHNIIQYKDFKNTVHKLFEINLLQVLCLQNVQPEEYRKIKCFSKVPCIHASIKDNHIE